MMIPFNGPCPSCGRCPTCGQYRPQLGPIQPLTGTGAPLPQAPMTTWKAEPVNIGGYYTPYPATDRSL